MAQINTESLSKIIVGKKLIKLVNEGLVHFVGTDTHSTMRGCDYEAGFSILEKSVLNKQLIQLWLTAKSCLTYKVN